MLGESEVPEGALAPLVSNPVLDLDWRQRVLRDLIDALDRHPLARRVLAGLEPQATQRVLQLPALDRLRGVLADRLRDGREFGLVRPDLDVDRVGRGLVSLWVTLLLAAVQFGTDQVEPELDAIRAIVDAAVVPP